MAKEQRKKIDVELLKDLAKIHCTLGEMASILETTSCFLVSHYDDLIKKCRDEGKCSLRRAQWIKAMEGNVPMLIWLGKHVLNQRDTVELTTTQPEVRKLLGLWEENGVDPKGLIEPYTQMKHSEVIIHSEEDGGSQ